MLEDYNYQAPETLCSGDQIQRGELDCIRHPRVFLTREYHCISKRVMVYVIRQVQCRIIVESLLILCLFTFLC